jgi:hypothetical protein
MNLQFSLVLSSVNAIFSFMVTRVGELPSIRRIAVGSASWKPVSRSNFEHKLFMTKLYYIYRDAITGHIVTEEYARRNPRTTVRETVYR